MSVVPARIAVVGLGGMGTEHLQILAGLPNAEIGAIADSHAVFVERAAQQVPAAVAFYDPIDCVKNADVDAVVVATADDTHHGIVEACIARGLVVLCEKPLTTTSAQSLQLVNAERGAGRQLVQVGFMRRFGADYAELHQVLRSGRMGEPVLINQRHRNPSSAVDFDERELIVSSASHDIDVFRWLSGDDVAEVSAASKASADGTAVSVLLTLKSRSGILGVTELGRGPGLAYEIGCDIVASAGVLRLDDFGATDPAPAVVAPGAGAWMARFHQAYRAQDAAWIDGVATKTPVAVGASAYDGYATNAVIDAALAALSSGRCHLVETAV